MGTSMAPAPLPEDRRQEEERLHREQEQKRQQEQTRRQQEERRTLETQRAARINEYTARPDANRRENEERARADQDAEQRVGQVLETLLVNTTSAAQTPVETLARVPGLYENARRLAEQLLLLAHFGEESHPCVIGEDDTPRPVHLAFGHVGFVMRQPKSFFSTLYSNVQIALSASVEGIQMDSFSFEDTMSSFIVHAGRFIRKYPDEQEPTAKWPDIGGYPFRVDTTSSGLRVHVSDAYMFDPQKIYRAPTRPVDGRLTPGIYIFGASHFGQPAVFDSAEYEVPDNDFAKLEL